MRSHAISKVNLKNEALKNAAEPILLKLAKTDPYATVRASAIQKLGEYKKSEYVPFFTSAVNDSSYTIAGFALTALMNADPATAATIVKQMSDKPAKGALRDVLMNEMLKSGDESLADKLIGDFAKMPLSQGKFEALNGLSTYLSAIKNSDKIKWGIDEIVKFRDAIPEAFQSQTSPFINGMILKGILADKVKKSKAAPADVGLQQLVEYIKAKLPEEDKKGF